MYINHGNLVKFDIFVNFISVMIIFVVVVS